MSNYCSMPQGYAQWCPQAPTYNAVKIDVHNPSMNANAPAPMPTAPMYYYPSATADASAAAAAASAASASSASTACTTSAAAASAASAATAAAVAPQMMANPIPCCPLPPQQMAYPAAYQPVMPMPVPAPVYGPVQQPVQQMPVQQMPVYQTPVAPMAPVATATTTPSSVTTSASSASASAAASASASASASAQTATSVATTPVVPAPAVTPVVVDAPVVQTAGSLEPIVSMLGSPVYEEQFKAMDDLVKLTQTDQNAATAYVHNDIYSKLIDILNLDTSKIEGPTEKQLAVRTKLITNQNAVANGKKAPFVVSPEDEALANELSPFEKAESNKLCSLITMAHMGNVFNNELVKQSGGVAALTDLPCAAVMVDAIKNNANPNIRETAIAALSLMQRPEYKNEMETVFSIAQTDENDQVCKAATIALENLKQMQ